jgi:homotetrameric cytidine deaminase
LLRREYDAELNACFLGDILISVPHAEAQALEYGHSLSRELSYLLAHGIFHLCGYDHAVPAEQKEMRAMEEKALQLAGETRDRQGGTPTDDQLLRLAREAMRRSYSPYSRFRVGACVLCEDGRIFTGCNVENASFGLTNCAERTAIFKAVSEGAKRFAAIAIAAENAAPWPCGACRQVLNEFAPDIRVLVTWGDGQTGEMSLSDLLPHGFGPKDLP